MRIRRPRIAVAEHLTADNIPVRFPLGPSLSGIRRIRFALLVRGEPEHALEWRERTRSSTVRTFDKMRAALLKTFEFDGNHPRKRAFGRFGWLHLLSRLYYRISCVRPY